MIGMETKVSISEKAVEQIRNLQKLENKEGYGLRVGVKSGGCSGLSYFMEFKQEPLANDQVLEFGDVKIFVDVFSGM